MPDMHTRVSGAWKKVDALHVKVSGTWKEVQNGYVKVSGAWEQFFSNIVLDAGNGGTILAEDFVAPYNTTVAIRFNTDGTVERGTSVDGAAITWVSHGTWIDPTSAASGDFSVRYTNLVSAGGHDFTTKAATEDTWIDLGTQRVWSWNRTTFLAPPNNDFDCDFEVRDDVGVAPTASDAYKFQIENSA